jgi:hypothetical protein
MQYGQRSPLPHGRMNGWRSGSHSFLFPLALVMANFPFLAALVFCFEKQLQHAQKRKHNMAIIVMRTMQRMCSFQHRW